MGPFVDLVGPQLCNVHTWVRKIKNAFDPQNGSDHTGYISPEPPKLPPGNHWLKWWRLRWKRLSWLYSN